MEAAGRKAAAAAVGAVVGGIVVLPLARLLLTESWGHAALIAVAFTVVMFVIWFVFPLRAKPT